MHTSVITGGGLVKPALSLNGIRVLLSAVHVASVLELQRVKYTVRESTLSLCVLCFCSPIGFGSAPITSTRSLAAQGLSYLPLEQTRAGYGADLTNILNSCLGFQANNFPS